MCTRSIVRRIRHPRSTVLGVLAAGLLGCGNEETLSPVGPPIGSDSGSFTLEWTVQGESSAGACDSANASDLMLDVENAGGRQVVATSAACSDFAITVDLPAGDYTANAALVNPAGRPVSTNPPLDLEVLVGTDLIAEINFENPRLR